MLGLVLIVAWLLLVVGEIWLLVTAIKTGKDTADKIIWAIVCLVCPPIGGIVYFFVKKQGRTPMLLQIVGAILMIVVMVMGGGSFSIGSMPE